MPTIDQLAQTSTLAPEDELPIYSKAQHDTRKVSTIALAAHVRDLITGEPDETIYTATMSGSSFTVTALPTTPGGSVWAQIALSGPAPAGTIILPGVNDRADGQEVLVTCTQAVAALTVNGNGAATAGAPTVLAANGFFRLRFDSISATWYRIG